MRSRPGWTFAIVSVALFMVTLDNLVVTNALVSIREDLGASLEDLEWTVNAYTLSYAVFLLTAAALGDRFGRRRVFAIGIGLFTVASAAAAFAPSTEALIGARPRPASWDAQSSLARRSIVSRRQRSVRSSSLNV